MALTNEDINERLLQAIISEYEGRPADLARDSSATRRTAENWLKGKHVPQGHHLLNIVSRNGAFSNAWTALVLELRAETKGRP